MGMVATLTKGMNLWGLQGSVNMEPGEAAVCQDVAWRPDGAIYKTNGWRRNNLTGLTNPALAHKGFSYKGKNTVNAGPPAWTARAGNLGLADDGADYTRRAAFYSSAIALCDDGLYYWNPATGAMAGPVTPVDATVNIIAGANPIPTILVLQNNCYIVGWADDNLRWDPVDRLLYRWGWANTAPAAPVAAAGAAGDLIEGAVYRYRISWIDIYTGEESRLSNEVEFTATATGQIDLTVIPRYNPGAGLQRHYVDAANAAGDDVGAVIYRTDADDNAFYFVDIVNPGVTTFNDTGLALDYSIKGDTRAFEDPVRLNAMVSFKDMWYGLAWDNNWARFYYNDFRAEKSFIERADPRDYREVPIEEGEYLTAPAATDSTLIMFTNKNAHQVHVTPNATTGKIDIRTQPLFWPVGCVGPQAWQFKEQGLYWLSERGPYRLKNGVLQFIGLNVQPLFIDPQTSLCQLNETGRVRSVVGYHQDQEKMHFAFPCGSSSFNNRHISYYLRGEDIGNKYYQGWTFESPTAQFFDATHAYEPLTPAGVPIAPQDKRERFVFSDINGYIYEYDTGLTRAGAYPAVTVVTGTGQAGSTVNTLVTLGPLPIAADGLDGLRLEVVYSDGTIDVRTIGANTATDITPDAPFTAAPVGATWYIAGIPFYWRSWYDHDGAPHLPKTLLHLSIGSNQALIASTATCNLVTYVGDFADAIYRNLTYPISAYRAKEMISQTGRFHQWELANSHPDEPCAFTYFNTEYIQLEERYP